jgi:hypothetical protein
VVHPDVRGLASALDERVSEPLVLHIISGLGVGGAEGSLVEVAGALQECGLSQHVVCLGALDERAADLRSRGVKVTVLGVRGLVRMATSVVTLARLIQHDNPAVVQGWMYHGNIVAALAHRLSGGRGKRRLYWNLRASNVDAERYRGVVRLSAMLSRVPDLIVANSHTGKAFHIDQGFRANRIEVVSNGIDTQKFCPDTEARMRIRADLGISPETIVAIHAARVDPMKDHATFLAAMTEVPQLRGLLAGAGTDALALPDNVRALGLRHDLARLYAAADIVVSSSAFAEGFSNVIAEGMSTGLIPVATDVGDACDIIGDSGAVVPVGDAAALAAALTAIVRLLPDERRARGMRARERIIEQFPVDKMIETYARLYDGTDAGLVRASDLRSSSELRRQ